MEFGGAVEQWVNALPLLGSNAKGRGIEYRSFFLLIVYDLFVYFVRLIRFMWPTTKGTPGETRKKDRQAFQGWMRERSTFDLFQSWGDIMCLTHVTVKL